MINWLKNLRIPANAEWIPVKMPPKNFIEVVYGEGLKLFVDVDSIVGIHLNEAEGELRFIYSARGLMAAQRIARIAGGS